MRARAIISSRFRLVALTGVIAAFALWTAGPAVAQPVEGEQQKPKPECKPGETKKETSTVIGKTISIRVTEYVCNKDGQWVKVKPIQQRVTDAPASSVGPTTATRTKQVTTVIRGAKGTTKSTRYFVREEGGWHEVDSLEQAGGAQSSAGPMAVSR